MAINFNNTPLPIYFSRNQVAFRLDCSDVINTAGVQESRAAIISSELANDDTLTITWSHESIDYSAAFTFKTSPNAENFEILANTGSPPSQDYIINTLIPGLLSHPDIAQFFDARVEEDTFFGFRLISRVGGPITLAFAINGFTASELSTAGVLEVRETDYLATAWVYMANEHNSTLSDFTKIGELELYPAANNLASIDISEILDSFFTAPEIPTSTTNALVECTEINREFFLLIGQKFGDPVARKKQVRSDVLRVLKGGVRHPEFLEETNELTLPPYNGKYLTLRTTREVAADQLDWLFICPHKDDTEGAVQVQLFYTDYSTTTQLLWGGQTVERFKTYQFAAGFTQAGIKAIADGEGKTCYKYTLQFGEDAGILFIPRSELATFYVMPDDHLATVMHYENTLGGVESWQFIGNRFLAGSKSSQSYRTPLEDFATVDFQELSSYNEEDTPQLVFNTGPMSQSDALAFRDFLRSRHKWLIIPEGDRLPFRIADTNYRLDSENMDSDFSRNFEFTAILAPAKGVSRSNEPWT